MWYQQTLTLSAKPRGFHLVTDEVIGQIRDLSRVKTGLLHLLLQHTSPLSRSMKIAIPPSGPTWSTIF